MITKILFTLTVIVGVILFFKTKRNMTGETQSTANRRPAVKAVETENQKMFRQGAYLFLGLMILSAVFMMAYNYFDSNSTVTVHVIDTQTGRQVTYQAKQQEIKSRRFTTVKGRVVFVADNERVEIEPD